MNLKDRLSKLSYASLVRYKDLIQEIDEFIGQLNLQPTPLTLKEKVYIIENSITTIPVCKMCDNKVTFNKFRLKYNTYCSPGCSNADPQVRDKSKQTCIRKYGVDNPQKCLHVKEKSKKTCMEKYGVDNVFKTAGILQEISKKHTERYTSEQIQQIREKYKRTSFEKYGTLHPKQNKDIQEKTKQTCLEKYGSVAPAGSKEVQDKIKQTCMEKYGVEHSFQRPEIINLISSDYETRYGDKCARIKANRKEQFEQKYGVSNPFQYEPVKEKIKETNKMLYQVENPMQNKDIQDKVKKTCTQKYGVDNILKSDRVKQINRKRYYTMLLDRAKMVEPLFNIEQFFNEKDKLLDWRCKKCHAPIVEKYNGVIPTCPVCFPGTNLEVLIVDFLKRYNVVFQKNIRTILPHNQELDFYVPEKKLAIEIHGLYWHSESTLINRSNPVDPKLYHSKKLDECNKLGIKLIQIFSDELMQKPEIVFNRLRNSLGLIKRSIHARDCQVKEVDFALKTKFLNKYHIQGTSNSKINLGLYYKNRLVSVMTFNQGRVIMNSHNKPGTWELARFCGVSHFKINGAAGKLFSHFINDYSYDKIITYADRRWSNGQLYTALGFKYTHTSKPNYFYTKDYKVREYRFKYTKHALVDQYPHLSHLSESNIMKTLKYDRIYDCGALVFTYP